MCVGRWIGPAIDVGTAMAYIILRPMGIMSSVTLYGHMYLLRRYTRSYWSNILPYFVEQFKAASGPAVDPATFPYEDPAPGVEYYADSIEDDF